MRFGSVCSGIEAASVASQPLGWQAAWFSEIEKFPREVLAHHYQDVPNLGDMTALPDLILSGKVEAPDLLVGGTPCQAFSVAGKRASLDDARGNLSLIFCRIADAIDERRSKAGQKPCIVFWENVPGVINTKDNAFGCFLGELAGEVCALEPPGGRWSNAGCVFGPKRAIAWRVLDAQYFGVAQRRRRVFVVASARNWLNPAEVLFEPDGVRRDTAPSRETGEEVTTDVTPSLTASGRGVGRIGDTRGKYPVAFGGNNQAGPIEVATARNACASASGRMDFESETFLVQPVAFSCKVRRLTPIECERLQGFPDNYTNIKPNCPDSPRYKALGNSWAVPCVQWIFKRINDRETNQTTMADAQDIQTINSHETSSRAHEGALPGFRKIFRDDWIGGK